MCAEGVCVYVGVGGLDDVGDKHKWHTNWVVSNPGELMYRRQAKTQARPDKF